MLSCDQTYLYIPVSMLSCDQTYLYIPVSMLSCDQTYLYIPVSMLSCDQANHTRFNVLFIGLRPFIKPLFSHSRRFLFRI